MITTSELISLQRLCYPMGYVWEVQENLKGTPAKIQEQLSVSLKKQGQETQIFDDAPSAIAWLECQARIAEQAPYVKSRARKLAKREEK